MLVYIDWTFIRCRSISFAIRESRIWNRDMNLKPQDLVLALKLCGYLSGRPPISVVAGELGLSSSEVHGAIQRLRTSRLLHGPALKDKPNISGLEEFLVHGLKYAFPAKHGEVTRGILVCSRASKKRNCCLERVAASLALAWRQYPGHGAWAAL